MCITCASGSAGTRSEMKGAGRLAATVRGQCASLAHLNLSVTKIGDKGVGRLAAVPGQCASLDHLDLSGNKIEAETAGRLAAVLVSLPQECSAAEPAFYTWVARSRSGSSLFTASALNKPSSSSSSSPSRQPGDYWLRPTLPHEITVQ